MAEQNLSNDMQQELESLPKDVQQALENLTGTDKELLKTVVSEKGELNEEALENVSGGVSLSEAGTKTLNWLKNNYGKVGAGVAAGFGAGVVAVGAIGGVLAYIYRDDIKRSFKRDAWSKLTPEQRKYAKISPINAFSDMRQLANANDVDKNSHLNKI